MVGQSEVIGIYDVLKKRVKMALTKEQLALRKGKMTGSQANILMRGDPYEITDLWKMHIGDPSYVEVDFTDNWPVRLGELTETLNLEWASRKYGPVTRQGEVVVGVGSLAWTAATLDGWLHARSCPIEAKCVNGRNTIDDVIPRYLPQITWQMMVTKTTECALSVIVGGAEPVIEFVPLNRQYARALWMRAQAFWTCVKTKTPPVELPAAMEPPPIPTREYDMTSNETWQRNAQTWIQAYGAAQTAKECEKALKAIVPPDAKLASGHGVIIVRNRTGAMSLREAGANR